MIRRIVWAALAILLALVVVGVWAAPGRAAEGTPTPFVEPPGCQLPPDDYTRVWVNGVQLNARTLAMLDHAQALYSAQGGIIDFRLAITRGATTRAAWRPVSARTTAAARSICRCAARSTGTC